MRHKQLLLFCVIILTSQLKAENLPTTTPTKKESQLRETTDLAMIELEIKKNNFVIILGYKSHSSTSNVIKNMTKSAINSLNHRYKDACIKAFCVDVEKLQNPKVQSPGQLIFYKHGQEIENKTISVAHVYPYKKLSTMIEKSFGLAEDKRKKETEELKAEEEKIAQMAAAEEEAQKKGKKLANKRKKKLNKPLKYFASKELSQNQTTRSTPQFSRNLNK